MENFDLYKIRHINYAVFSSIFEKNLDSNNVKSVINLFTGLIEFASLIENEELKNQLEYVINFLKTNSIDELNRIYTSIFISGAYGKIICPVESIYVEKSSTVMGEKRDEVLEIYSKDKFSLNSDFKEQEDHIAAELSYISMMNYSIISSKIKDIQHSVDKQYNFIKNHIIPLLINLNADLKIYDKSLFYYYCGIIILKYIEYDFIKSYE